MNTETAKENTFDKIYKPDNFRAIGHELIDFLADHLNSVQTNMDRDVYPHQTPDEELAFWKNDFESESDPMNVFKNITNRSMQLQHPRFIGHQTTVPAPISSLAGLMSDFLNNGTGVFEMGPASNAMEKVITDFTAQHIGYNSQAAGMLTSGGTLANLTALLTARKVNAPGNVWQEGHNERLAVLVSEEAHYCIDRAARILGLGEDGIVKVPVDENFKIRTELMPKYLEEAKNRGLHVFCVIGCAGSTATGSYDDLDGMADFCQKNNLWFHVDGAHGGAVVFSKKHRNLAKGIEKADSVVIDFHKMLMTPSLNTALIYKNGHDSYKTFAQKAQYLWDAPESEEWYNSAKRTFECTKSLLSAKIYIILKTYGKSIFEKNVNHLYHSAAQLTASILKRPDFELAIQPEANIVNFRYIPDKSENREVVNTLNADIRQQLIDSGKFYIVQTTIKDIRYLRCTVMNPLTTLFDFEALLDEIKRIASNIKI